MLLFCPSTREMRSNYRNCCCEHVKFKVSLHLQSDENGLYEWVHWYFIILQSTHKTLQSIIYPLAKNSIGTKSILAWGKSRECLLIITCRPRFTLWRSTRSKLKNQAQHRKFDIAHLKKNVSTPGFRGSVRKTCSHLFTRILVLFQKRKY